MSSCVLRPDVVEASGAASAAGSSAPKRADLDKTGMFAGTAVFAR